MRWRKEFSIAVIAERSPRLHLIRRYTPPSPRGEGLETILAAKGGVKDGGGRRKRRGREGNVFNPPAPANAVRRAQASAELSFAIRRRIHIRREVANGKRKTNCNRSRKPPAICGRFSTLCAFHYEKVCTERNALTDQDIISSFFGLCRPPRVVSQRTGRRSRRTQSRRRQDHHCPCYQG